MPADLDRIMQRTRQYWHADGIPEIAIGALLLATGLLFAIEAMAPTGSLLSHITAYGLPLLLLGGIFGAGRCVKIIKARLTYPRTGYVAYARPTRPRRIFNALISILAAAMLAYAAVRLRLENSQTLLIQSLCAAILIAVAGMGLVRFYALAAFAVGLGIMLSRLALDGSVADAILFAAIGTAFVLSGGLTLYAYLKHSFPASEDPS